MRLDLANPATIGEVLDAHETAYPMLRGTIRDHITQRRRPFVRFFACGQNLSLASSGPWLAGSRERACRGEAARHVASCVGDRKSVV